MAQEDKLKELLNNHVNACVEVGKGVPSTADTFAAIRSYIEERENEFAKGFFKWMDSTGAGVQFQISTSEERDATPEELIAEYRKSLKP